MTEIQECDALIIGGGYYGCSIALHLKKLGLERIIVAERDPDILQRASYCNQARIHNGYHYPRSIQTARSSRLNFHRWINDNAFAVDRGMRMIYGLAQGSLVNPAQFERFCNEIGAPFRTLSPTEWRIFNPERMLAAYEVEELAFNASLVAEDLRRRMSVANIDLKLSTTAQVEDIEGERQLARLNGEQIRSRWIFNCTYAELDTVGIPTTTRLRREWAEMALITPPADLRGLGVTVMDGPFFSSMPFPALGMHTMSHVRFTPITAWTDGATPPKFPYSSGVNPSTNGLAMVRDAARYMPIFQHTEPEQSIYAIKSVLLANDNDDGRPILFEFSDKSRNVISVLGGKIDNIYDVFDAIDEVVVGQNLIQSTQNGMSAYS